uniref:LigA n=1 Tax=Parastrongyloides trichosuri TaxID=131310 RepID=A0A0N4Z3V6_PARTI
MPEGGVRRSRLREVATPGPRRRLRPHAPVRHSSHRGPVRRRLRHHRLHRRGGRADFHRLHAAGGGGLGLYRLDRDPPRHGSDQALIRTPGLDRRLDRRHRGQAVARPGDRRVQAVGQPGQVRRHRHLRGRGHRGRGRLSDRRRTRSRREAGQDLHRLADRPRPDFQGSRRRGRGQHARRREGL